MTSGFFGVTSLDYIHEKAAKFRYTSCALSKEHGAFGTSAGSVHIFSLSKPSPPIVVSLSSLINPVTNLSFSPQGKWLVLGDQTGLHFIEDPTSNASLFFSIKCSQTCVCWTAEPPGKLNKQVPYILVGDENGAIHYIRHQGGDLVATLAAPIVQLSTIEDTILAATQNGVFLVKDGMVSAVGRRQNPGRFGAVYVSSVNAICVARPAGKLSVAATDGKIKATLSFLKGDEDMGTASPDLGELMLCPPFIVSLAKKSACYVIDLVSTKLVELMTDLGDLVSASNDHSRVLVLCRSKVLLFEVVHDVKVYITMLAKQGKMEEARTLIMEQKVDDPEILELVKTEESSNADFTEYVEKIEMKAKPKPLKEANPKLYEELMAQEIPTKELMAEIEAIREFCVFDEEFKKKVDAFVIAHPNDCQDWIYDTNPNVVVPILNEREETAELAMEIAKRGDSDLCKMLTQLDSFSMDVCVANSPPLRAYNFKGQRRSEFEKCLKAYDIMACDESQTREPVVDSLYNTCLEKVSLETIDEAQTVRLLKLYEWEMSIRNCVKDMTAAVDSFVLTQEAKDLPPWIDACMEGENLNLKNRDLGQEGSGNWGVVVTLTTCPICGMQHNLGESVGSISVFPCSHAYHIACLHTSYCPICYTDCVRKQ